jgi:hypothetical protein
VRKQQYLVTLNYAYWACSVSDAEVGVPWPVRFGMAAAAALTLVSPSAFPPLSGVEQALTCGLIGLLAGGA